MRLPWCLIALACGLATVSACGLEREVLETELVPVDFDARPWFPRDCSPLPSSSARDVRVTPGEAADLPALVAAATPGTTFLLEDGAYTLDGGSAGALHVLAANVTLRGASGDASRVVLDGGYSTDVMVAVSAPDFTLTDVTLTRVAQAHVRAAPLTGSADRLMLHRAVLRDTTGDSVRLQYQAGVTIDDAVIACSLFEQSSDARARLTDQDRVVAINASGTARTLIFRNVMRGFNGGEEASGGVTVGGGVSDVWLVRNWIEDASVAIRLGKFEIADVNSRLVPNPPCAVQGYADVIRGGACNNVVIGVPPFDTGIAAWAACGTAILHNTIYSTTAPALASIEWRYAATLVEVVGNLATHDLLPREDATATLATNLEGAPASTFVNAGQRDLHLAQTASLAIDRSLATLEPLCAADYDGASRDALPDLGAFELVR